MTRLNPVTYVLMVMLAIFALSQGLTYPLLANILEHQGHGKDAIGWSTAMTPLGILFMGFILPTVTARVGARRWALITAIMLAILVLTIGLFQNIELWFALRFLIGICAASQFAIAETWIVTMTPAQVRGRVLGFYNFLVAAGFAAGPSVLAITGSASLLPFFLGAGIASITALLVLWQYNNLPRWEAETGESGGTTWAVLPLMLFIALATFTVGGIEQVTLAFFSLFLQTKGFLETQSYFLLSLALGAGAVSLLLVGLLIDFIPRRTAWILVLSTAGIAPLLLLPLPHGHWSFYPISILWGVGFLPIFLMCMVEVSDRFQGQSLLSANAVLSIFWGAGGLTLPPLVGFGMEFFSANTFIFLAAGLPLSLLALKLVNKRQHSRDLRAT